MINACLSVFGRFHYERFPSRCTEVFQLIELQYEEGDQVLCVPSCCLNPTTMIQPHDSLARQGGSRIPRLNYEKILLSLYPNAGHILGNHRKN